MCLCCVAYFGIMILERSVLKSQSKRVVLKKSIVKGLKIGKSKSLGVLCGVEANFCHHEVLFCGPTPHEMSPEAGPFGRTNDAGRFYISNGRVLFSSSIRL